MSINCLIALWNELNQNQRYTACGIYMYLFYSTVLNLNYKNIVYSKKSHAVHYNYPDRYIMVMGHLNSEPKLASSGL